MTSQLQMDYAKQHVPAVTLPAGYTLRLYQPGDEPGFSAVMMRAGFGDWDHARLRPWIARIIPDGWFMAVDSASGAIVATAMCLHDHTDDHPFGAELGWVAADPAHQGKGLGMTVSAACTGRLLAAGYRNIHLYTEDFRLAAIRTYLKLGYQPYLYAPDMPERWRILCEQLGWAYTPQQWRTAPHMRL